MAQLLSKIKSFFFTRSKPHEIPLDFDPDFYLGIYSDLREAGVDPISHYISHGKKEGRLPCMPTIEQHGSVENEFLTARENILIVSHEASLTGAPILCLNLVQHLSHRYNIVVVFLGGGELIEDIRKEGVVVIGPCEYRNNPSLVDKVMCNVLDMCPFKFALVNSIESRVVLPTLASRFVPIISLLHEFAAYTRPRDAFRSALFWSGEAVFSANLTLENVLDEYPEITKEFGCILPQGRCKLPPMIINEDTGVSESVRIRKALYGQVKNERPFIVVGAGYVQIRKGVDLFIDCAARVIRANSDKIIRFVWVGKGYDPEIDVGYSVYLEDQIKRAGLEKHITFAGETTCLNDVYEAADLLLLTSRLDPLPNVAIDALCEGVPVLCFDKTTGIADILIDWGLGEDCVVPYLDTKELSNKLLRLASVSSRYQEVAAITKKLAVTTFDMEDYSKKLEKIASIVSRQTMQELNDFKVISESNLIDQGFFCLLHSKGESKEKLSREYVRAWASGISRRKPFPGFHPGIYLERHGVNVVNGDPLVDFIQSGSPAGPWLLPVIRNIDKQLNPADHGRVALHLHVFYPDLLPEMLERLQRNVFRPDLFVSIPEGQSILEVELLLKDYTGTVVALEKVPNRGRDIGPFLTAFGSRIKDNYDFVGHLHTKKSVDVKDSTMGAIWYRFLLENLLGGDSGKMMDNILSFMCKSPKIGMVFPDDPYVVGWGANKPFALDLAKRLGIKNLPEYMTFPVGTMFWARVDAIRPFWSLGLGWEDYPEEPLPYDGSMLHAVERLFPLGLAKGLEQCAVTNVEGMSR